MTRVSESLAGRLSLIELTPLLWSELTGEAMRRRRWLVGGYPDGGVLSPGRYPQWELDYLALLAQRDLPSGGLPSRPQGTERLMPRVIWPVSWAEVKRSIEQWVIEFTDAQR